MDLGLAGQVAVIVGGGRGIGLAIARTLALEGCPVGVLDIDAGVASTADQLAREAGVRAVGLHCDVTDYPAVQEAAAQLHRELGRVEHVVFAVAIPSGKFGFPFWNLTPADWPRVLMVNVVGAANVAHAFAPGLVEARSGTMLFLASVAGQIGSQTDPPYSASKAVLINFAQCAAKDLAPYNVRVNSLCPGMVKTALNRSIWEAWARQQPEGQRPSYEDWSAEKIKKVVPLNRWQDEQDIANMAAFLASPRAGNVTGQTINVDGGFVMR